MERAEPPRDWAAARASKVTWWRSLSAPERLRLADDLRRHALLLHPDWPTTEQRERDLKAHLRLVERIDRAASSRQR